MFGTKKLGQTIGSYKLFGDANNVNHKYTNEPNRNLCNKVGYQKSIHDNAKQVYKTNICYVSIISFAVMELHLVLLIKQRPMIMKRWIAKLVFLLE